MLKNECKKILKSIGIIKKDYQGHVNLILLAHYRRSSRDPIYRIIFTISDMKFIPLQ